MARKSLDTMLADRIALMSKDAKTAWLALLVNMGAENSADEDVEDAPASPKNAKNTRGPNRTARKDDADDNTDDNTDDNAEDADYSDMSLTDLIEEVSRVNMDESDIFTAVGAKNKADKQEALADFMTKVDALAERGAEKLTVRARKRDVEVKQPRGKSSPEKKARVIAAHLVLADLEAGDNAE